MKIRSLLFMTLLAFLGCSKDQCGINKIVLSNELQAKYKCVGLPNTYPQLDTISIERIQCEDVGSETVFSEWCDFEVITITIIE